MMIKVDFFFFFSPPQTLLDTGCNFVRQQQLICHDFSRVCLLAVLQVAWRQARVLKLPDVLPHGFRGKAGGAGGGAGGGGARGEGGL